MQVKKFEAPTMQEALKVIKRELGPEAIILSTKHIKSGFGLMSKASVEVTAAIAEKDLKKKAMAEKNLPQEVKEKIWNSKATKQSAIYNDYFEKQLSRTAKDRVEISAAKNRAMAKDDVLVKQAKENEKPAYQRAIAPAKTESRERRYADIEDEEVSSKKSLFSFSQETKNVPKMSYQEQHKTVVEVETKSVIQREIDELREMVAELRLPSPGRSAEFSAEETESGLTEELVNAMHDLVANGVEKKLARQLIKKASFEMSSMERNDAQSISDKIAYQMVSETSVADILEGVGASAGKSEVSIISLVGPTGVGKTTTIAKIASLGILERKLRVGLINLDSYKVAAADQLATYAKIMNLPFRSVTNREELQQAIYDFSSLDLVLIDTTGRSQKDQESLLQLRHLLATVPDCRSVLMMSATTKDSDMNEVIARFKLFAPIGLVFTKLDETSVYGCIYNAQKRSGLPLLYFTVGQRVPEDIEKASAERVADLVVEN